MATAGAGQERCRGIEIDGKVKLEHDTSENDKAHRETGGLCRCEMAGWCVKYRRPRKRDTGLLSVGRCESIGTRGEGGKIMNKRWLRLLRLGVKAALAGALARLGAVFMNWLISRF